MSFRPTTPVLPTSAERNGLHMSGNASHHDVRWRDCNKSRCRFSALRAYPSPRLERTRRHARRRQLSCRLHTFRSSPGCSIASLRQALRFFIAGPLSRAATEPKRAERPSNGPFSWSSAQPGWRMGRGLPSEAIIVHARPFVKTPAGSPEGMRRAPDSAHAGGNGRARGPGAPA